MSRGEIGHVTNIRALRTRKLHRLIEDDPVYHTDLPEFFRAPKANVERYDNERQLFIENGWFACKPQDRRLSPEQRSALAEIEMTIRGKR